jgi:hypothetical protein
MELVQGAGKLNYGVGAMNVSRGFLVGVTGAPGDGALDFASLRSGTGSSLKGGACGFEQCLIYVIGMEAYRRY